MAVPGAIGLLGFSRPPIIKVTHVVQTTPTVTIPDTVDGGAAGQLAILLDYAGGGIGGVSSVTPSGFSLIGRATNTNVEIAAWARVLTASDPGRAVTGMNDNEDAKIMVLFGGPIFASYTIPDSNFDAGDGNLNSQTVTSASGTRPLIVFGAAGVGGGDPHFSTVSPAFDNQIAAASFLRVGYTIYEEPPSNQTVDKADEGGNNALALFYIQPSLYNN